MLKELFQKAKRGVKGTVRGMEDELKVEALKETIKYILGKVKDQAGEITAESMKKRAEILKHVAESRDECMAFIARGIGTAEGVLFRAHLDRHLPYDNRVVNRVVMFYRHLGERNEKHLRRETFRLMAHMTPEEFDNFIEHLTNDFIEQYALMAWDKLKAAYELIDPAAKNLAKDVRKFRKYARAKSPVARASKSGSTLGRILDPFGRFR